MESELSMINSPPTDLLEDGVLRVSPSMAAAPAHAELAGMVLGARPLGIVLTRIAQLAREIVPTADEVSVTVLDRLKPRTVAFSGDRAAILDERQYRAGYGPCIDAAMTGGIISVDDTTRDRLYPEFTKQAARAGIRHILAIGLQSVSPTTTGALNLYGSGEAFDDEARDVAVGFAAYVAVAVTNAAVFTGALLEVEQMREAMVSRAVIEQAKGIIMGRQNCNADEAFDTLRGWSNDGNRKVRDLAALIVAQVEAGDPVNRS